MDLKELQRMTTPKLRDLAKELTDLQGVLGMHKDDLIKAIAKAQGIAYDESVKDVNAIHAIKQDIRALQKAESGTFDVEWRSQEAQKDQAKGEAAQTIDSSSGA